MYLNKDVRNRKWNRENEKEKQKIIFLTGWEKRIEIIVNLEVEKKKKHTEGEEK